MELNEIKKRLYKEKPVARFTYIKHGIAHYYTDLDESRIHFSIPISDMGEAQFDVSMDAKLLIRWIVT